MAVDASGPGDRDGRVPIATSLGSLAFTLIACALFVASGMFLVVAGVRAGLPRTLAPVVLGALIATMFAGAAAWVVVRTVRRGPVLVLTPTGIESHGWFLPWGQVAAVGIVDGASMASPLTKPRMKWVGVRLRDPAILAERSGSDHDPIADRFTAFADAAPGTAADIADQVEANRQYGGGFDFVWPAHLLPGRPDSAVELITEYGQRHGLQLD